MFPYLTSPGKRGAGLGLALILLLLPTGAPAKGFHKLYSFCARLNCADGAHPKGRLLADKAGNLYGTTSQGGAPGCGGAGCGTIFRFAPDGTETVLYDFTGGDDGASPGAGLIFDAQGNLYGTAQGGGAHGHGVVFRLAPDGTETALYAFTAGPPNGGAVRDAQGNLYGIVGGGAGGVFKLALDGTESVFYGFCAKPSCADGEFPNPDLVIDKAGNLYGTTYEGGDSQDGTVFRVAPDGTETVLHSFCANPCSGGSFPEAGLTADKSGNLYGTTRWGGSGFVGTVFRVSPGGKHSVLYSFRDADDGGYPVTPVTLDRRGDLFGCSLIGGTFELEPDGTFTIIDPLTGENPMVADKRGRLFGTTPNRGVPHDAGTVFMLKP